MMLALQTLTLRQVMPSLSTFVPPPLIPSIQPERKSIIIIADTNELSPISSVSRVTNF